MTKISEKKVELELNFGDGETEIVELNMDEYLQIELMAERENKTFEQKFNELLEETINDIGVTNEEIEEFENDMKKE